MKLDKKKSLASRTLKVGKERIAFVGSRLEEIKEAITKQDIKDLHGEGAIRIKEASGKRKVEKRKRRRRAGKIKKVVNTRKRDYMTMTRKLRTYVMGMRDRGEITSEDHKNLRNKIRNRDFNSLANMKNYIKGAKR
jgi:large subunit ribosomal protein L19e